MTATQRKVANPPRTSRNLLFHRLNAGNVTKNKNAPGRQRRGPWKLPNPSTNGRKLFQNDHPSYCPIPSRGPMVPTNNYYFNNYDGENSIPVFAPGPSSNEQRFIQPEISQLTQSQEFVHDSLDAGSARSSHSYPRLKQAGPPLHQNSSVSSASSNTKQDHPSVTSYSRITKAVYPGKRFQNQNLSTSTSSICSAFKALSKNSGLSVHSRGRVSAMDPSQSMLRKMMITKPGGIKSMSTIRSIPRPRKEEPQPTSLFFGKSDSSLPPTQPASQNDCGQDSKTRSSVSESFPPPSASQGTPSTAALALQIDELKALFQARMKGVDSLQERVKGFDVLGQTLKDVQEKMKKVEKNESSLEKACKQLQDTTEELVDAKLSSFDDKLRVEKKGLDEKLQILGDSIEARRGEFDRMSRKLEGTLTTMGQTATSYIEKIETAGESRLEAISKKAKELAEATIESISQKVRGILQPTKELVGPVLHRPDNAKEVLKSHDHPPSTTISSQQVLSKRKKPARKRRCSYSEKKAAGVSEVGKARSSKDKWIVPTAKQSKRVKVDAAKENKTPNSSKPCRVCVTPPGEDSEQLRSLPNSSFLREKKISGRACHRKAPAVKKPATSEENTSKSDSLRDRIPFDVISPNVECPSPLGNCSVQALQRDLRRGHGRKRSLPTRFTQRKKDRVARTYGKRSLKRGYLKDDSFSFA